MGAIKALLVILLVVCAVWGFMTLNMALLIGGTFSAFIALVFVEWMSDVSEELEKQTKALEAINKHIEERGTDGVSDLKGLETVAKGIRTDLQDIKTLAKEHWTDSMDEYETAESVSPDMARRRRQT